MYDPPKVKENYHFFLLYNHLQECPEVALDAVVGLCQALSPAHRGEVVKTLSQLEFTEKEHASMG